MRPLRVATGGCAMVCYGGQVERGAPDRCRVMASTVVVVALVALAPGAVLAADCMSMLGTTLVNTSANCSSQPSIVRVFGSQVMSWNGRQFLVVNKGNELGIWSLANPQSPAMVASSSFAVGNQGDSDYDLRAFSVCDDCRYGVAWYKLATVLFDLGTDPHEPEFVADDIVWGATFTTGGMVFAHGGSEYLATASGLADSCSGTTTLYRMTGASQATGLSRVGCVAAPDRSILLVGGHEVGGHLYLADSSTRVYLFRVDASGSSIALTYLSQPMRAVMNTDHGLAVDAAAGVAIEANTQGASIWDIASPGSPLKLATIPGAFNRAAVSYPLVFLALGGIKNSEQTWDISDPTSPVPLHQAFWSAANVWNFADHLCSQVEAGRYSPDGTALYLMRYSRLQVVDTDGCLPPAPLAAIEVAPATVFPGDTVTIADRSSPAPPRSAIWVTAAASSTASVVFGSATLSTTTPAERGFTVDPALPSSVGYWAHVAVEDNAHPYLPGQTPSQLATRAVSVDRTPTASLAGVPAAALVGDVATAVVAAEGHPADPAGGDARRWTVTRPDASVLTAAGGSVDVAFTQPGPWRIAVEVRYRHQVAGVPWVATATKELEATTPTTVFADGFEGATTAAWTDAVP